MTLKTDEILNHRYQILRVLSDKGGMGMVYLADDRKFSTKVVIKRLRFTDAEAMRQDEKYGKYTDAQLQQMAAEVRQAFEREAKLLFRLSHRALPRVFDRFQTAAGDECLVMDFIPGEDFDELLRRQSSFALERVLDWAEQLLDVLEYLHGQQPMPIVHRDINPRNLKLTPNGRVVLLDFGLAKGSLPGMTVVGSVLGGSNDYAPLEQLDDDEHDRHESDPRSDLYSLALRLYHLLSGRKPASALARLKAQARRADDPLRPLNEIAPQVPATVAAALQRAAALLAEDRPASELRRLLRQSVAPAPPKVVATPPEPELPTVVRPKPVPEPEPQRRIVMPLMTEPPEVLPPPPRISAKIEVAIQSSRKILEWADDWDEEGSKKFEAATWKRAVQWLRATARTFHRLQGVWIEPPRILPGPEGSIDIHWKNTGRELLVNFPENAAAPVEYYGSGSASDVIKGKLDGTQASAWILVFMKMDKLKERLRKDRPATVVTLNLPEDVVRDLQRVALQRGFMDFRALLRAYVGQGLRVDLERLNATPEVVNLIAGLQRQGVAQEIIINAVAEANGQIAA